MPHKVCQKCNTFDFEVMFIEKLESFLYSCISFGSSEWHIYHSQLGQWTPSIIHYTLGPRYVFNEIRYVSKLAWEKKSQTSFKTHRENHVPKYILADMATDKLIPFLSFLLFFKMCTIQIMAHF